MRYRSLWLMNLAGRSLSEHVGGPLPATTLATGARATNPTGLALDPVKDIALFEDLSGVRGRSFIASIVRAIRNDGAGRSLRFVSGHTGAGKSTELARLRHALEQVKTQRDGDLLRTVAPKAQVLMLDAFPLVREIADLDLEDLLVGLWQQLIEQHASSTGALLATFWKTNISKLLQSTLKDLPNVVAEALQKLSVSLRSPAERKSAKTALFAIEDALIEGLNRGFEKLRDDPSSPMVVIIDNLEKLSERSRDAVEKLYLDRLAPLLRLDAHLVLSAPSFLLFEAKGQLLTSAYGAEVLFVPMVKVRRTQSEGGGEHEEGVSKLAALLARRVNFDALFEGGMTAARKIAVLSGGRIRDALMLVYRAINEVDEGKVPLAVIEAVADREVTQRSRGLPEAWSASLRFVQEKNRFPLAISQQDRADMLRGGYVLEYQNGEPSPFYVVHPLIERTAVVRAPLA
jgi:hypothetical protein